MAVRIGARVATAGPEAEGPSDVPPWPHRDGLSAVAIQKVNRIKRWPGLQEASEELRCSGHRRCAAAMK